MEVLFWAVQRFPRILLMMSASTLALCFLLASLENTLWQAWLAVTEQQTPNRLFETVQPLDTVFDFAEWTDWTWLQIQTETVATWIMDPKRELGLTNLGALLLLGGVVAFAATKLSVVDPLAVTWLSAALLAELQHPAWVWALTLVAAYLAAVAIMTIVIWRGRESRDFVDLEPWMNARSLTNEFAVFFWGTALLGWAGSLVFKARERL